MWNAGVLPLLSSPALLNNCAPWKPCSLERSLDILVHSLRPGDTVYDVGGNLGVYTVLLAKVVGEKGMVVAFEPHHETYEQLLDNVRLNGLTNVRAFQKALGERNFPGEALYRERRRQFQPVGRGDRGRCGQRANAIPTR